MTSIITEKYGDTLSTLESLGEFGKGTVFGAIKADGSSIDNPFYIVLENDVPREVYMPVYSDEYYPQSEFAQIEEKYKFFEDILDLEEDEDVDEEPLEYEVDNDLERKVENKGYNPYRAKDGKFTSGGSKQLSVIEQNEAEIRNNDYETFVAVSPEGDLVAHIDGTQSRVTIPPLTMQMMRDTPGTVFTHNHPSGASFSQNDLITGARAKVTELRAVSRDYTYSIRPKDGKSWPGQERIKNTYKGNWRRARTNKINKYKRGTITLDEVNDRSFIHEAMQKTAIALDLDYKRTEVK